MGSVEGSKHASAGHCSGNKGQVMTNYAQRSCRFISATACSSARVKVMDVGHGSWTGTPRRRSASERVSSESLKPVKQGGRVWQRKSHDLDAGPSQGQVTKNNHVVWQLSRVNGGSVDFDHRAISSERRSRSSSEAVHGSCLLLADCQHSNSVGHGHLDSRHWRENGGSTRDIERNFGKPDRNGIWGSQNSLRLDGKQLSTMETSVKKISSTNGASLRYKGQQQMSQKCGAVTLEETNCQSGGQYPQHIAANRLEHARDRKHALCESNGCDREPQPAAGRRLKADAVNVSKAGPKSSRSSFSRGENCMRDSWLRQSVPGILPSKPSGLSKSHNHGLGLTDDWQRSSDPTKRLMESSHGSDVSRRLSHPPHLQRPFSGNVFERLASSPTVQSLARERSNQDKAPLLSLQGQGLSRSLTVPIAVRKSVLSQSTMALPVSSRSKSGVSSLERRLGSQSEVRKAGGCPTSDKQMRDRLTRTSDVTTRRMRSVSPPAVRNRQTDLSLSAVSDRSKRVSNVHEREALSSRASVRCSSSGLKRITLRRGPGVPPGDDELSLSLTLKTHVLMEEKDSELYWDGCRWMVKFKQVEKSSDHHRAPFCGLGSSAGTKVDRSEALTGGIRMRRSSYEKGNKVPPPIIQDRIKSTNDNTPDQRGQGRGSCERRRPTLEPANIGEYVFGRLDTWRGKKDEAHTEVVGVNVFTGESGSASNHSFAGDILGVEDADACVTIMAEEDMDDVGEMREEGRHDDVEAQLAFELLPTNQVGAIAGCQGMKTFEEVTKVQKGPQNVDGLECTQAASSSLSISSPCSEGIVHIGHGEGEVHLDTVKRSVHHKQLSVEPVCDAHLCEDMCNTWEGQPSPVSALDFPGSEDEASPLMRRVISSRDGSEDAEIQEQLFEETESANVGGNNDLRLDQAGFPGREDEGTLLQAEVISPSSQSRVTPSVCKEDVSVGVCTKEEQRTAMAVVNIYPEMASEVKHIDGPTKDLPLAMKEADDEESWIELLPPEAVASSFGTTHSSDHFGPTGSEDPALTGRPEVEAGIQSSGANILLDAKNIDQVVTYVRKVLSVSGLASAYEHGTMKRCDGWKPLDPALYERLEKEVTGANCGSTEETQQPFVTCGKEKENVNVLEEVGMSGLPCDRRLIFDAVNDALAPKLLAYSKSPSPWLERRRPYMPPRPTGQRLIDEILKEIQGSSLLARNENTTMDSVLRRDITREKDEWSKFDEESTEIGCDMEGMILDRLLFEAVEDFVDIENKRSEKFPISNPLLVGV